MRERRQYPRYGASIPVELGLADTSGDPYTFSVQTMNVSREGIAVVAYEEKDKLRLLLSLLLQRKSATLDITLPDNGDTVGATGSVRWHQIESTEAWGRFITTGLLLEKMKDNDRLKWEQFVDDIARRAEAADSGNVLTRF
jgi:hypothetical protein